MYVSASLAGWLSTQPYTHPPTHLINSTASNAGQEIPCIVMMFVKTQAQYRVQNSLPLILGLTNQVHTYLVSLRSVFSIVYVIPEDVFNSKLEECEQCNILMALVLLGAQDSDISA
jgi:hypothetical protein